MREVLVEVGTQIVFDLLMLLVGVLFAYLGRLFAKSEKLKHISLATDELESVVVSIVGELQQTTVDSLKAASADGKLTKDEIRALGELLIEKATEQLGDPAAETLKAAGVDIEGMIHSIAEACIAEIKRYE